MSGGRDGGGSSSNSSSSRVIIIYITENALSICVRICLSVNKEFDHKEIKFGNKTIY